jgi:hypothetical protein
VFCLHPDNIWRTPVRRPELNFFYLATKTLIKSVSKQVFYETSSPMRSWSKPIQV